MKLELPASLALLFVAVLAQASPSRAAVVRGPSAQSAQYGRSVAGLQVVPGHLRPEILRAPIVGVLPASQTLHLAIGLPIRNRAEATRLAAAVSNPASASYRHYLTPAQYQARFGPALGDYQSILAFAQASHFTITRTYANRMIVDVDAPVSAIQQAFHLTMQTRVRPDGSVFYAPSNDPALAASTPILHIAGLDNEQIPRPQISKLVPLRFHRGSLHRPTPDIGSGPGDTFAGSDFRNAYARGTTLNGTTQCLGLLEFDSSFFPADIASYQSSFGLPPLVPQKILLNGFSGVPVVSSGERETALDIEVGQAMAPNLTNIFVFEGSVQDDILAAMAAPNGPLCSQLSASWTFGVDSTSQQLVEQMALQGQSFFVSSGDAGGFTSDTNDDRDMGDTTVVGGTELQLDDNFRWLSEVAWPGSGGGVETSEYVPGFQRGLVVENPAGKGSTSKFRMVPDVAMVATNTFLVADNGGTFSVSGTSISTPLWAAYTALINQQAILVGAPAMGFPNPALYAIARNPALYPLNFHDVTLGNNGPFSAEPGYDMVTGWGSPQVKLIGTLDPPPTFNFTKLQIIVYSGGTTCVPTPTWPSGSAASPTCPRSA